MYLNLFRQDIKKKFLLKAFQQSLNSSQKTAEKPNLGKKSLPLTAAHLKAFFQFFCFDFLQIDPSNNFCFCKFFANGLKSEGEKLKVKLVKNWQGSAKLSPLSLSPTPFRVLQRLKKQCNQISNECLEKFLKKLAS